MFEFVLSYDVGYVFDIRFRYQSCVFFISADQTDIYKSHDLLERIGNGSFGQAFPHFHDF